ncbi:hypothetical protein E4U46_007790 [Claviceps purpurea]|nr:hypothetical protein E4U46_007790 [Claviceps purpurea]
MNPLDCLAFVASLASPATPASPAPSASLAALAARTSPQRQTMDPSAPPQAQPGAVVKRRKVSWSPSEDDLLKSRVLEKGARDWVEISSFVGSRSAKQCRERWHHVLDPRLDHGPITREEGDLIFKWVARKGQQWAEIARQLKGRSDNGVKNWYNGVQKKMERREKAATSLAAQRPCCPRESLILTSLPNEGREETQNHRLPGVNSFCDVSRFHNRISDILNFD